MNKLKSLIIVIAAVAVVLSAASLSFNSSSQITSAEKKKTKLPQRIVSLSPSITEIVFFVGAGERLVGVTKFCAYPAQAKKLPEVGGFVDPDYEKILLLSPDLVITRTDHVQANNRLKKLGLNLLTVEHTSINGIINSIAAIGEACGKKEFTAAQKATVEKSIKATALKSVKKLKVLLCVGRNMGDGSVTDVYVAGRDGLYDDLIRMAGGINVCAELGKYPKLGPEGIQRMNPDIIIDLAPGIKEKNITVSSIRQEWYKMKHLKAVKDKNVYVITEDYCVIPGPRIFKLVADINAIIKESEK